MKRAWHGLAEIVAHARARRAVELAMTQGDLSLRERVAIVAPLLFGPSAGRNLDDCASAAGIAALAIQSRGAPETWLVRPSASRVIVGTDLHSIPDKPPRLLTRPGVVEAHRPETGDRLWGNIASLGWCQIESGMYLFGIGYPEPDAPEAIDWAAAKWSPEWTGQDLEPQMPGLDLTSPLIRDLAEHNEFARNAVRYLTVFGLLAEVQDGPLSIELDHKTKWRHVRLTQRTPQPRIDARPEPPEQPVADEQPGRVVAERTVTGHLKRQRYGERSALVKWIYIEGYSARRWCMPRWVVSKREGAHE